MIGVVKILGRNFFQIFGWDFILTFWVKRSEMLNKTGFPGLTVIITKFETDLTGPEFAQNPSLLGF